MLIRLSRLHSSVEYKQITDELVAKGLYRNDSSYWKPGMGYYADWYYDPTEERQRSGRHVVCQKESNFLSSHYWADWSDKRPPIIIFCPNGREWCIDQKANNGEGWKVTGEWPNLTCSPSIVVPGYHGFLRNGEFTADIEGRGDCGTN